MAGRIQGIFFDLGDTLLEFGRVDVRGLFEAGARLAHDYLQQLGQCMPPLAKYHRRQLWAIRWSYFKSRLTRREFNSLDLIGRLSESMGHDLTPRQTEELAWMWYKPLRDCATVEEGLHGMLANLRGQGLSLGVISNTFIPGQVLDRHLDEEGFLGLLTTRVYSCDVLYRKPDVRIFRIALERAGLEADRTFFVGDSLQADIDGANRAGMISVLKTRREGRLSGTIQPRHRIRRVAELKALVASYNGG